MVGVARLSISLQTATLFKSFTLEDLEKKNQLQSNVPIWRHTTP